MESVNSETQGIRRTTLTQQVVALLKRRILDGELISGNRLWAADLAEDLGTSIAPVKEALLILQTEGFVTNIPRRGSIVRQFTFTEMEELYDLRELIETEALNISFKAGTVDDELIDALADCNERIGALRENGGFSDQAAAFELDRRFHDLIIGASGHTALAEWYTRLNEQVQIIRYSSWNIGPRGDKTYNEHAGIIAALSKNSFMEAKAATKAHLQSIRTDFRHATKSETTPDQMPADAVLEMPHGRRKLKQHASK